MRPKWVTDKEAETFITGVIVRFGIGVSSSHVEGADELGGRVTGCTSRGRSALGAVGRSRVLGFALAQYGRRPECRDRLLARRAL